ncbi:hypothetical protein H2198_009420 [Neophaeococcomyces mojaviensis]|uniref:Uncharacterized protein n=1 Tax=Neophaeococcomyces mojaviensis TaxID=3383035 RepID=A0ACC2ZUQ3_9EURO|nr:hypothetical protein H2198_009420 [Knufia sp. JES_112]
MADEMNRHRYSSSNVSDPENYDWNTGNESRNDDIRELRETLGEDLPTHIPPPASPITRKGRPELASDIGTYTGETVDETMMRLSNEFTAIAERDADTLVYIGIPPQEPGQSSREYKYIQRHFERPYLMRSDTLRRVNSSKLEKFLGPMSARTERRLKKQQVHKLVAQPERLKYYIDLSPVLNDDEALIQVTELTVPKGALTWHQKANDYCVEPSQICGRDTLNPPARTPVLPTPEFYIAEEKPEDVKNTPEGAKDKDDDFHDNGNEKNDDKKSPLVKPARNQVSLHELPVEEEYSSLRHHTTIGRLLHAIAGNDPKLNSAAKVWSFCMLAKYFDCAQSNVINHWVEGWLLQGNNNNFIQVNPSIAYRLATAIQSVWLTRCSFAVLVGKKAMLNAASEAELASPSWNKNRLNAPIFQYLDDDEVNRIDHAASSLHQRVKNSFAQIVAGTWMEMSRGIIMLKEMQLDDDYAQQVLEKLKRDLLSYVQRRVCTTITHELHSMTNDKNGERVFTSVAGVNAYNELPISLRVLTREYWAYLKSRDLNVEPGSSRYSLPQTVQLLKEAGLLDLHFEVDYISREKILGLIYELNRAQFPERYLPTAQSFVPDKARKTDIQASPSKLKNVPVNVNAESQPVATEKDDSTYKRRMQPLLDIFKAAKKTTISQTADAGSDQIPLAQYKDEDGILDWSDNETQDCDIVPSSGAEDPIQSKNTTALPTSTASVWVSAGGNIPSKPLPYRPAGSTFTPAAIDAAQQDKLSFIEACIPLRMRKRPSNAAELFDKAEQKFQDQHMSAAQQGLQERQLPPLDVPQEFETKVYPSARDVAAPAFPDQTSKVNRTDIIPPIFSPGEGYRGKKVLQEAFQDSPPRARGGREIISSPLAASTPHNRNSFTGNRRDGASDSITYSVSLFEGLNPCLSQVIWPLLTPGYQIDGTCDFEIPMGGVSTLLCLNEEEWKYLPLWAGGLDDGSGGVFTDGMEVPDAPDVEDGGFRGGAMGVIPGVGSSLGGSIAGSEFEDIATEVGVSTVGKASRVATDGTATVISLDD